MCTCVPEKPVNFPSSLILVLCKKNSFGKRKIIVVPCIKLPDLCPDFFTTCGLFRIKIKLN